MSIFADSSALVKLYSDEPGHESIRAAPSMIVSQLARVEVPAAIWRKHRVGELTPGHARILVADFEADYLGTQQQAPRFTAIRITPDLLTAAARLCAVHSLRAYEAVQLATAIIARDVTLECDVLAAFDVQLRRAGAAEGFAVMPAHMPEPERPSREEHLAGQ